MLSNDRKGALSHQKPIKLNFFPTSKLDVRKVSFVDHPEILTIENKLNPMPLIPFFIMELQF